MPLRPVHSRFGGAFDLHLVGMWVDFLIAAVLIVAAGTAHELNTPLSTLAILVDELDETTTDPAQKQQLRVMAEELAVINERLNSIAGRVGAERSAGAARFWRLAAKALPREARNGDGRRGRAHARRTGRR